MMAALMLKEKIKAQSCKIIVSQQVNNESCLKDYLKNTKREKCFLLCF